MRVASLSYASRLKILIYLLLCYKLLQYHTVRNVLFMAMTEFQKVTHNFGYLTLLHIDERAVLFKLLVAIDHYFFLAVLQLTEEPDWTFVRANEDKIAFLFGVDDHWGPLSHLEEVSR